MSKASRLVSGVVPGVERQPLKKLEPDATALVRLIERWRNEAVRAGRPISRIALAYEAGRDGFWLARWLIARGIEAHVIHPFGKRCGVTRAQAGEDGPTGCGDVDARIPGMVARRDGALRDGGDPDDGGGRCEAPEPRAREPCRRALTHDQPHDECARPARDSQTQ